MASQRSSYGKSTTSREIKPHLLNFINGNNGDDNEVSLVVEQLCQNFQKSLDLNFPSVEPTLIDVDLPSKSLVEEQAIHEEKLGEKRKVCPLDAEISPKEGLASLDLELKLAPPVTNKSPIEPSMQTGISSPSNEHSCTSLMDMDESIESDTTNKSSELLPSLSVMGCRDCYIYVMVSEVEPQCPQCNCSNKLIDVGGNPAKRSRKC